MKPNVLQCRSCGADMIFIKSALNGKNIPCNPNKISVITPDGKLVWGHVTHFAECPQADQWSKKKRRT